MPKCIPALQRCKKCVWIPIASLLHYHEKILQQAQRMQAIYRLNRRNNNSIERVKPTPIDIYYDRVNDKQITISNIIEISFMDAIFYLNVWSN